VDLRQRFCGFAMRHGKHVSAELSDFPVKKFLRGNPRWASATHDQKGESRRAHERLDESLSGAAIGDKVIVINNQPRFDWPRSEVCRQILCERVRLRSGICRSLKPGAKSMPCLLEDTCSRIRKTHGKGSDIR